MDLRSTQSVTEMSTTNILWEVKAAGEYGWQPDHFHVTIVLKSGNLNLLELSGPDHGFQELLYLYLLDKTTFTYLAVLHTHVLLNHGKLTKPPANQNP